MLFLCLNLQESGDIVADLINKKDKLNTGREKLNKSIQDAENAKNTANNADSKATQALSNSEDTQIQLDQVVINGDSSVEAAQARVDAEGTVYSTLKNRLDDKDSKIKNKSRIIFSDVEPANADDQTFWYEDKGDAPVNFNPGDGVSVQNAITSDAEPEDKSKLWFDY